MIAQKIKTGRKLWSLWRIDDATKRFIAHNERLWSPFAKATGDKGDKEVLCNLDSVCLTHVKLSYLMNVLAKEHGAGIKTFSTRPSATQRRFYSVYQSFNTEAYIPVQAWAADHPRVQEVVAGLWPQVVDKQSLFDLKIEGVWLGIDILETYMQKCGRPEVDLTDPRLKALFVETVGLVLFWQDYFKHHDVRALGTSIDGYTANNTVTKVAQAAGVLVYAPDFLAPRIRDVPFAASVAFIKYREIFSALPLEEQVYGLARAKEQLDRRLSGEVGVNMAYSTKSAWHRDFQTERVVRPSARTKVLICSHDFVDAPHSHGGMLFVDFVEWLKFVAEAAHETDYDWYIKLHADHDPASADVVKEIAAAFPNLTIVPSSISHHQLIQEGINVVLTCYGSVGHEYPLMGIPVLNAGYNPHIAYSFNYHARSREEYRDYLKRLPQLSANVNPQDVYEFYYMYHYDELARTPVSWWEELAAELPSDVKAEPEVYDIWRRELTPERHQALVARTLEALRLRVHHAAQV